MNGSKVFLERLDLENLNDYDSDDITVYYGLYSPTSVSRQMSPSSYCKRRDRVNKVDDVSGLSVVMSNLPLSITEANLSMILSQNLFVKNISIESDYVFMKATISVCNTEDAWKIYHIFNNKNYFNNSVPLLVSV
mmetsp:Transcript_22525/g.20456  ORF Transcript_22525/g.20456 Transcript_22525/m.20456 type:complete len:135 (-) Transcript_22525:247-651(-)